MLCQLSYSHRQPDYTTEVIAWGQPRKPALSEAEGSVQSSEARPFFSQQTVEVLGSSIEVEEFRNPERLFGGLSSSYAHVFKSHGTQPH